MNEIGKTGDYLRIAQGIQESQLHEFIIKKFNLFDMRKVDERVIIEFQESEQFKFGYKNSNLLSRSHYKSLRAAGLTSSDIDVLRKLKGS